MLGGSDQEREGHWIWSDGGAWKEEHWESGQPDGFQVENCLVLNLSELLSTYLVSLVIKFSDFSDFGLDEQHTPLSSPRMWRSSFVKEPNPPLKMSRCE